MRILNGISSNFNILLWLTLKKSSKKFVMSNFQRLLEDIFATFSNFYVFDQDPAVATGLDRPVLTGDWSWTF